MAIQSFVKHIAGTEVVVRAYDFDGTEHMIPFSSTGIADIDALISEKISALNAQLAEWEFEKIVGQV